MRKVLKFVVLPIAAVVILAAAVLGLPRLYFGSTLPPTDFKQALRSHAMQVVGSEAAAEEAWSAWSKALATHHALYASRAGGSQPRVWTSLTYDEVVPLSKALDGDAGAMELARALLQDARAQGLFEQLAKLRESRGYLRPPGTEIVMLETPEDIAGVRALARLLVVRLRAAFEAGDQGEVLASVDDTRTLARLVGSEPILIRRLIAQAVVALLDEEVCRALDERLVPTAMAVQLIARLEPWPLPTLDYTLAGEALVSKEALAAKFGDTRIKALNRSYQTRLLDAAFGQVRAVADKPIPERGPIPDFNGGRLSRLERLDQGPAMMLMPVFGMAVASNDALQCTSNGTRLRLAIEQWRGMHGHLPAKLEDLVPEVLSALPADPFRADGFLYRVEPGGQDYVLYTVGLDGTDDGGKPHSDQPRAALSKTSARGTDYVFHAPRPSIPRE